MADGDFGTAVAQRIKERVPATRTIAGKPLTGDVTLTAADVGAAVAGGTTGPALERFRTLKAFGTGTLRVAVVGDSTGNDVDEWVRLWSRKYGALLPASVRRTYKSWTGSAWTAETVDAEGDLPVSLVDTFSRVGPVEGSTPDAGLAWIGTSGWVADGSVATFPPGEVGGLNNDLQSIDASITVTMKTVTAAVDANQILRMYVGTNPANTSGVSLTLTVNTSGGVTLSLHKTVSSVTATLEATKVVAGAVANSATPQDLVVTLALNGTAVTATTVIGGQTTTWNGVLDAADRYGFDTRITIGVYGRSQTAPFAHSIDRVEGTGGSSGSTSYLEVWNGSIPGATPGTFDATLRASQFESAPFDVVILNFGHNGGQTGPAFVTTIADWLSAWAAEHPESVPLLMSQNPRSEPATGIVAHMARMAALRVWAGGQGHPYIPIWETFRARPDGGDSLILPDGVHLTSPSGGALTGDFGSVLWADTVLAATL